MTALLLASSIVLAADRDCRAQQTCMGRGWAPPHWHRAMPVPNQDALDKTILRAMKKPVDLDFVGTPLRDIVEYLGKTLGVPVLLDQRALNDVGIDVASPVSFHESGISGRSALQLILRQPDLTWTIRGKVLVITTPAQAELFVRTKVYDVADLLGEVDGEPDFDSVINLINRTIRPLTWEEVGGPGTIRPLEADGIGAVAVSQPRDVQEEVAALLAELRRIRDQKSRDKRKPTAEKPKQLSPEEAIDRALAGPVDFAFVKTPLSDVAAYLRKQLNVPIQLDQRALANAEIEAKVPVSIQMSGVSARSVLQLMLGQLGLTWTVRDEVLLITTPEAAKSYLVTRVYSVTDLVALHDEYGAACAADYDGLIKLIRLTVHPASWDMHGGPGSVAPFESPGLDVLAVSQTRDVHAGIRKLLADLRAARRLAPGSKPATKRKPRPKPKQGDEWGQGWGQGMEDVPPQTKGGGFF